LAGANRSTASQEGVVGMKEWWTLAELGAAGKAGIAGLPTSKVGMRKRARREQWPSQSVTDLGGAHEEFKPRLDTSQFQELIDFERQQSLSGAATTLDCATGGPSASATADARSVDFVDAAPGIIPASEDEIAEAKRSYMAASEHIKEYARSISKRAFDIANQIIEKNREAGRPLGKMAAFKKAGHVVGRSKDKVRRDYDLAIRFDEEYRVMALIPGWGGHESKIERDPEIRKAILQIVHYAPNAPHTEMPQVLRELKKQFSAGRWLPSVKQIRYFLDEWNKENLSLHTGLTNPRRFNNEHLTAIGDSSAGIVRPNQQVQNDFTPADIELLDGRFSIGHMIDIFTHRRKLRLAEHPSGDEQAMLICDYMLAYGRIETLKVDRGHEVLNERIPRGLKDLGTELIVCHAFSGWEKGVVERGFQEIQRRIAELPGYCGPNVAIRQELRDRVSRARRHGLSDHEILRVALTSKQLRPELARIECLNDAPTSALSGLSPNQFAAQYAARHKLPRPFADASLLYLLFAQGAERIIGKEGIAYERADFWTDSLIPWMKQRIWVAETSNMGILAVYTADRKRFIDYAVNAERVGRDRREMALLARQAQARFVKEGRKAIGTARNRITAPVVADAVHDISSRTATSPGLRLVHDTDRPEQAAVAVASRALSRVGSDLSAASAPTETRVDDLAARRQAHYQKLIRIPAEQRTEEQTQWLAVFEHFDAVGMPLGKAI
jgi:hypothetical protein